MKSAHGAAGNAKGPVVPWTLASLSQGFFSWRKRAWVSTSRGDHPSCHSRARVNIVLTKPDRRAME